MTIKKRMFITVVTIMILGFSLKWSLPNETSEERPSGAGDIWWVQVPEIIESFRKTENDN